MPTAERTMPIGWDLTGKDAIIQGANWSRYTGLDYIDPDTGDLVPWDTTGYTARMHIRPDIDGPAVLTLTTENGRLQTGVTDSGGNVWAVVITLAPAATSGLADWGYGVYDLEIVDPYGHVTRIHEGRCTLSREATR